MIDKPHDNDRDDLPEPADDDSAARIRSLDDSPSRSNDSPSDGGPEAEGRATLVRLGNESESPWEVQNRAAWDELARTGHPLARPAADALFENPLQAVDAPGWLGSSIAGQRVLCLAAGGGRQGPLYAAAGAEVTVVDLSPAMLELDRQVAQRRHLSIQTVQTSMDNLSMFEPATFDLVIHPVSTCYLPDVAVVFRQVARVLKPGGLYISQHKQPSSLQAALIPSDGGYLIREAYYRASPLPAISIKSPLREPGAVEYLHRWEELIGGMCRAGLLIEDLIEPNHADPAAPVGTLGHRSQYLPPYVRIKARRLADAASNESLSFSCM